MDMWVDVFYGWVLSQIRDPNVMDSLPKETWSDEGCFMTVPSISSINWLVSVGKNTGNSHISWEIHGKIYGFG